MKIKLILLLAAFGLTAATSGRAQTSLIFNFDTSTNTEFGTGDGLYYDGSELEVDYTGDYSGTDITSFDTALEGNTTVNFSIDAVGDLTSPFTGTMTASGGAFEIGGNGSGIGNTLIDAGESWTFTFNQEVILNAANFYGVDNNAQAVSINSVAVAGSPFDGDIIGANYTVPVGQTLTFSQATASENYGIQDLDITVIPEPSSLALIGLAGLAVLGILRGHRKK